MGLIAHYPFINDAKDYSGNANNGTITGPYFENVGPFGRSLRFTLGSDKVVIPHTALLSSKVFGKGNNASISVWFRPTEASHNGAVLNKAGGDFYSNATFGIWQNNTGMAAVTGTSESGNPLNSWVGAFSPAYIINSWNHIVIIKNVDRLYLYINGIMVNSESITLITRTRLENTNSITIGPRYDGGVNNLRGNVSDLRIYDHALSLKEIKELGQAKVAHYNFAEFQEPTRNRLELADWIKYTRIGEYTDNGVIRVTRLDFNSYKFEFTANSPLNNRIVIGKLGLATSGVSYHTISGNVLQYYNAPTISGDFGITLRIKDGTGFIHTNSLGPVGLGLKSYTFQVTPSLIGTEYTDELAICSNASIKTGSYMIIENLQAEIGTYPRPFTDTFRQAVVNDISGHNRDIIVNQENPISNTLGPIFPRWVIDTDGVPAYDFNNTVGTLEIPFGNGLDPSINKMTISLWAKMLTTGSSSMVIGSLHNGNDRLYIGKTSSKWTYGIRGDSWNGPTTSGPLVIAGKYTHIVATLDGSNLKFYVDGVHTNTTPYASFTIPSNLFIGSLYIPSGLFSCEAHIRDVRVYGTALSNADILELYKERGYLDQNGSLKAIQFKSIVGWKYRFFSYPFLSNQTTLTAISNGIISVLSTGIDPYIIIGHTDPLNASGQVTQVLQTIDHLVYNVFEFKYRAQPFADSKQAQVFFTNATRPNVTSFTAALSMTFNIVADGEWHTARVNMFENANWAHSRVTALRLDWAGVSGVAMDIDYIALVKNTTNQVTFNNIGEFQADDFIESGGLDQLSHWWPLDGHLREISAPIEYTATASGHSAVDVYDKMGFEMTGTSSYISCNASQVDMNYGTISLWVKIDPTQVWDSDTVNILGALTNTYQWARIFSTQEGLRFYYRTNSATVYVVDILRNDPSISTITTKFNHLVLQYADANDGGFLKVFINGVMHTQIAVTTNIQTVEPSRIIALMANGSLQYPTKGTISDVRIYKKILTDQEVQMLYKQKADPNHLMSHTSEGKLYIKGTFKEV